MDRRRSTLLIAAQCTLLVAASAMPARAQEHTILGKKIQVQDPKPGLDLTKRKIVAQAKELSSPDDIIGDPTVNGATLDVLLYDGTTLATQTYAMPSTNWFGVPGVKFKYKDRLLAAGPVGVAMIAKSPASGAFKLTVTLKAKNPASPINVAPQDPSIYAGVVLTINGGDKYCVSFGGTAGGLIKKNDNRQFKIISPANEALCPSMTATCGNAMAEPPFETCDVGDPTSLCPDALCGSNGLPCLCPFCGDSVNDPKRCIGGSAPGTSCNVDNDCPDNGTCFDEECDGCDSVCAEGCSFTCECTTCGDGLRQAPAEECEPGEPSGPNNFCPGACLPAGDPGGNQCHCATCGDNAVNLPRCIGGENYGFGCSGPADCPDGTCFTEACDGTDAATCTAGGCLPQYDQGECTCTVCGNATVEPPFEICEPGDDTPCAGGACQANCTCCGDGIVNAGEVCEPGDNTPCDNGGTCQANCTCCGDGIANADEDCDGTDAGNCASGLCDPNCTCVPLPPVCPP